MKVKLRISKDEAALFEGIYDIADAESFGRACADAWLRLRDRRLGQANSIGALFEALDERLLDELHGAEISIAKA